MTMTAIRRETKNQALLMITAPMKEKLLAAQMCQFNNWRLETNLAILTEMSLAGFVEIIDGFVRRRK